MVGTKTSALTALTNDAISLADILAFLVDTTEALDADKGKQIAGDVLARLLTRPPLETYTGTARVLTAADDGKIIVCTNVGAITVTMPDGLVRPGFTVTILRGDGAGAITIQGDGTIELDKETAAPGTGVTATVNTRGVASIVLYDTASTPDKARVFGGIA